MHFAGTQKTDLTCSTIAGDGHSQQDVSISRSNSPVTWAEEFMSLARILQLVAPHVSFLLFG